jgi:hypothetical protein
VVLSPDKQAVIREQAKRPNLAAATLSEPVRVDMVSPEEVELLAMPEGLVANPDVGRTKD